MSSSSRPKRDVKDESSSSSRLKRDVKVESSSSSRTKRDLKIEYDSYSSYSTSTRDRLPLSDRGDTSHPLLKEEYSGSKQDRLRNPDKTRFERRPQPSSTSSSYKPTRRDYNDSDTDRSGLRPSSSRKEETHSDPRVSRNQGSRSSYSHRYPPTLPPRRSSPRPRTSSPSSHSFQVKRESEERTIPRHLPRYTESNRGTRFSKSRRTSVSPNLSASSKEDDTCTSSSYSGDAGDEKKEVDDLDEDLTSVEGDNLTYDANDDPSEVNRRMDEDASSLRVKKKLKKTSTDHRRSVSPDPRYSYSRNVLSHSSTSGSSDRYSRSLRSRNELRTLSPDSRRYHRRSSTSRSRMFDPNSSTHPSSHRGVEYDYPDQYKNQDYWNDPDAKRSYHPMSSTPMPSSSAMQFAHEPHHHFERRPLLHPPPHISSSSSAGSTSYPPHYYESAPSHPIPSSHPSMHPHHARPPPHLSHPPPPSHHHPLHPPLPSPSGGPPRGPNSGGGHPRLPQTNTPGSAPYRYYDNYDYEPMPSDVYYPPNYFHPPHPSHPHHLLPPPSPHPHSFPSTPSISHPSLRYSHRGVGGGPPLHSTPYHHHPENASHPPPLQHHPSLPSQSSLNASYPHPPHHPPPVLHSNTSGPSPLMPPTPSPTLYPLSQSSTITTTHRYVREKQHPVSVYVHQKSTGHGPQPTSHAHFETKGTPPFATTTEQLFYPPKFYPKDRLLSSSSSSSSSNTSTSSTTYPPPSLSLSLPLTQHNKVGGGKRKEEEDFTLPDEDTLGPPFSATEGMSSTSAMPPPGSTFSQAEGLSGVPSLPVEEEEEEQIPDDQPRPVLEYCQVFATNAQNQYQYKLDLQNDFLTRVEAYDDDYCVLHLLEKFVCGTLECLLPNPTSRNDSRGNPTCAITCTPYDGQDVPSRCRHWPFCYFGTSTRQPCKFWHPNLVCKRYPDCPHEDEVCPYIHPKYFSAVHHPQSNLYKMTLDLPSPNAISSTSMMMETEAVAPVVPSWVLGSTTPSTKLPAPAEHEASSLSTFPPSSMNTVSITSTTSTTHVASSNPSATVTTTSTTLISGTAPSLTPLPCKFGIRCTRKGCPFTHPHVSERFSHNVVSDDQVLERVSTGQGWEKQSAPDWMELEGLDVYAEHGWEGN